jgi:hypothetical protein
MTAGFNKRAGLFVPIAECRISKLCLGPDKIILLQESGTKGNK